jgi:hypothetical protein
VRILSIIKESCRFKTKVPDLKRFLKKSKDFPMKFTDFHRFYTDSYRIYTISRLPPGNKYIFCFLFLSVIFPLNFHHSLSVTMETKMDMTLVFASLVLLSCVAVGAVAIQRRQLKRLKVARKPRIWVRPWIGRRMDYGFFETLMQELANEDRPGYKNFIRMYPDLFNELVNLVSPLITRKNTNMRQAIPPDLRLALTLRFLATGKYHC